MTASEMIIILQRFPPDASVSVRVWDWIPKVSFPVTNLIDIGQSYSPTQPVVVIRAGQNGFSYYDNTGFGKLNNA